MGNRLGLNPYALLREGFAIEANPSAEWGCRPDQESLQKMATVTGISVDRLRGMTLLEWAEAVRDDEAGGRFNGFRYQQLPPNYRERGLAVCSLCLRTDPEPYVRRSWLVGWTAICPIHDCVLIVHCPSCHSVLKVPRGRLVKFPSTRRCRRCCFDLASGPAYKAPAGARRMQAALDIAKKDGVGSFYGRAERTWKEIVDACDAALLPLWVMTFEKRASVLRGFYQTLKPCDADLDCTRSRLGALCLLDAIFALNINS